MERQSCLIYTGITVYPAAVALTDESAQIAGTPTAAVAISANAAAAPGDDIATIRAQTAIAATKNIQPYSATSKTVSLTQDGKAFLS
jgi:hypothetical protein